MGGFQTVRNLRASALRQKRPRPPFQGQTEARYVRGSTPAFYSFRPVTGPPQGDTGFPPLCFRAHLAARRSPKRLSAGGLFSLWAAGRLLYPIQTHLCVFIIVGKKGEVKSGLTRNPGFSCTTGGHFPPGEARAGNARPAAAAGNRAAALYFCKGLCNNLPIKARLPRCSRGGE